METVLFSLFSRPAGVSEWSENKSVPFSHSPIINSPVLVLKTIIGKVETQASNIVVNLADSPLSFEQIENALRSNPIEGLKKLYLMKGGEFRVIGAVK